MLKRLLTLAKDSVVYGTGNLLNQLIGFLLLPLYTRLLTPTDYGVASMLALLPLVFVTFATSGMKTATFWRFNKCADEAERRRMFSTAQSSVIASAVILAGLALVDVPLVARVLFGSPLAFLEIRLTIATAVLASLCEVPRAALQSHKRPRAVAMLNVLQFLVTTVTTIALVAGLSMGVRGLVIGGLVGQIVATLATLVISRRNLGLEFSRAEWSAMNAYGRPYLPHRLMSVLLTVFADWVVRERLGLHEAGLYSIAARFAAPVTLLTSALLQAWQPYKYEVLHEDLADRAFFASILTYFVAVFGWLWVGLSVWGAELLWLMAAPEYHAAAGLVWVLVLMRVTQGAYPMLATGVDVGNNTRWVPLASLIATVVMVPATLFASASWGAAGAGLGSTAGWLTMAIAFYFISQRVFPIPYDLRAIFSLILAAIVFVIGAVLSLHLPLLPRLIIDIALSTLYPATVLFVLNRSPVERARMQRLVAGVRARLVGRPAV